jgi:hypothetical protein
MNRLRAVLLDKNRAHADLGGGDAPPEAAPTRGTCLSFGAAARRAVPTISTIELCWRNPLKSGAMSYPHMAKLDTPKAILDRTSATIPATVPPASSGVDHSRTSLAATEAASEWPEQDNDSRINTPLYDGLNPHCCARRCRILTFRPHHALYRNLPQSSCSRAPYSRVVSPFAPSSPCHVRPTAAQRASQQPAAGPAGACSLCLALSQARGHVGFKVQPWERHVGFKVPRYSHGRA